MNPAFKSDHIQHTHTHTYILHTLIHNTDPHTYAYTQTHMYSYFHIHICTYNIDRCTFIKANTYQKLYPIYTLLFRNPCLWGPRDTWWYGLREATMGSCFNPCSSWSPHLWLENLSSASRFLHPRLLIHPTYASGRMSPGNQD